MSSVWNTAESLLFGSSDVSEERSSHHEADAQQDEQSQDFPFQNLSSSGGYVTPSATTSYSRDDLSRTSFTNAMSSKAKVPKGRNYSASKNTSSDFGSTGINVICTTPSESLSHENYDIVGIDNSSGNSYLSNSNCTSGSSNASLIGSEPIQSSNSQYGVSFESSDCLMTSASSTVASHVTVGSGNTVLQSSASLSTGFIPSFEEVKKQISFSEKKKRGRGRGSARRAGDNSYTRKRTKNISDRKETLASNTVNHTQFLNDYEDQNDDREQLDGDSNVEVDDDNEEEDNDGADAIDVCGDDNEQNFTTGHNSTTSDSDDDDDDDDEDNDDDDDGDDGDPVNRSSETNDFEQHQGSFSLSAISRTGVGRSKGFLDSGTSETGAGNSFGNGVPLRGGRGRPRGSRGSGRGRGRGYLPPAVAEGLARHKAVQQKVYKMKYKHMKNFTRSLVLENAALCDLVAEVQQKIVLASEKRRFLLKKLHSAMLTTPGHNKENPFQQMDCSALSLLEGRSPTDPTSNGNIFGGGTASAPTSNGSSSYTGSGGGGAMMMVSASGSTNTLSSNAGAVSRTHQHMTQRKTRGGRRGAGGVGKSKRLCPPITLDSAGRPLFPICLGPLTIHSLGEIVSERPAYHRVHVIYPVGFCSSRTYASVTSPTQAATYTCKILDAGNVPRFELVCEEPETGEERVFSGSSPSECHNMVLAAINSAPGMPKGVLQATAEVSSISDRGLRFFGLSHPSVQNVLQACPGARKCVNYHWIKFEVCRSEGEVDKVLEAERDTGLCHDTLLRNIRFVAQAL